MNPLTVEDALRNHLVKQSQRHVWETACLGAAGDVASKSSKPKHPKCLQLFSSVGVILQVRRGIGRVINTQSAMTAVWT